MKMYNFVFDLDYWDKHAKTNVFNKICSGYPKEEDFWKFQPDVQGWNLKKDMRFLDFGCGPGRIIKTVAPLVAEYYGVDHCERLILKAKLHNEHKNVQFFVNNGHDLTLFNDNMFDFVLEHLVFIHLQKDLCIEYINEIYRILKPGGIFLSRALPDIERYVNGFSSEEIEEVFSIFKVVDAVDSGGFRRCIK
jgi:ubiquinone/menaquinone biosynthesis C-methylase UbiE